MQVQLFIPCFIDQFYPGTAINVVRILRKLNVKVIYNTEQTCCGQPAFNSGYWKEARKLAIKFIGNFGGDALIVVPSASCAGYVRNYFTRLFEDDAEKSDQAGKLKMRMVEFSDFLVNHLKVNDLGAFFPHRATYHDACSALREYGIREEPRQLLRNVKGIELVEMEDTDICCGFGGTFSARFHHISTAMTEQKLENAVNTGAEYIVSTEASCLMNLESYIRKQKLSIRTIHLADVLASGW